ncbi:MAG: hypothetical protein JXB47_14265 [Anaerolineae bacterium]|nr:hypothetical protein [Anaerolineae bacterium]
MAQNLFTEIVYNLDTRRIESFKLKPWADRFLMLRASLYQDESELSGEKENSSPIKGEENDMPPRRFELLF